MPESIEVSVKLQLRAGGGVFGKVTVVRPDVRDRLGLTFVCRSGDDLTEVWEVVDSFVADCSAPRPAPLSLF